MSSLLDRQRERFLADPDDGQAFAALEEELHLAGQWDALIEVYLNRIGCAALADDAGERSQLYLRLGQLHQDRRGESSEALECYREALHADPNCRGAMTRMRKLHAAGGQWEIALQIAEAEAALPQRPAERARLLSEIGAIWLDHLDDHAEALGYFSRALAEHPDDLDALEGSARVFEADDRPEQAARAWDHAIGLLRGPARARALVSRARLADGALDDPQRARELYRKALSDDPANAEALRAMVDQARLDQKWVLLADLQERRFDIETDTALRSEIAVECGRVHLDELENPNAATLWFERAAELDPDDPATFVALADLARERGDDGALLRCLERAVALSEATPAVSVLLELATLHTDQGDTRRALEELELAFESAPDDSLVAEALCEVLSRVGRDEQLVEVLEQRVSLAGTDDELRAILLAESGRVHEERLSDATAAADAFERAFAADPDAPGVAAALERLYRKGEDWSALRGFLERAADSPPVENQIERLCALAALLEERLDERGPAIDALERALDLDPGCAEAHRRLQRLADGDADALARAYQRQAEATADPTQLAELVAKIAPKLEADGDLEAALYWIEKWSSAQPESGAAALESARLHERLGHGAELVAALEKLDGLLPPHRRAANLRRMAAVHREADRVDAAIDAYRSAQRLDPYDVTTLEPLATALAAAGRIEELAQTRRQIAGLVSLPARVVQLEQVAELEAERLGDVGAAIDVLVQVKRELRGCESGLEPAGLDDRLEAYLERAARYAELADQLELRISACAPSDPEWVESMLRLGDVLFDQLARYPDAAAAFRSVCENAGGADLQRARAGLERALRSAGDPAPLADFLAERMERADDAAERDACAYERAVLLEESLDREAESLALYRRLAASAGDDALRQRAARRLEEQLERNEQWELLRAHLESSLGDEADGDCRIHERLGSLYRDRLRNWPRAIDQFEAATTIAPERADLWRILASLYEREGNFASLVNAMEAEIAAGCAPDRELTLRSRAAELCVHPLDDADRAQEHYERVIELDPQHATACDFLVDYWTRNGNPRAVVELLERRLGELDRPSDDHADWPTLRASLRLRIAELLAGDELDDLDAAIAALEPAIAELGAPAFVAEPLADLYARASRIDELSALCANAAAQSAAGDERALWYTRLGEVLRGAGRDRDAAQAYRGVLTERPDDRDAQSALCELYRRLGDREPLIRLLELELSRLGGEDEIAVRLELAGLLESLPSRRGEALLHLKRVLAIRFDHSDALERALDLAERLLADSSAASAGSARHSELLLELLGTALRNPCTPQQRASHLARRARLAGRQRIGAAIADYRESIALDARSDVIGELRELLAEAGHWEQVLDCVYQQCRIARDDERTELYRDAVEIAWDRLSPQAALPWLERLRQARPQDVSVVRRITEAHRLDGGREAALRAMEAELALDCEPARQLELHLERARIFGDELGSPGRAADALERALLVAPGDSAILERLAALYQRLGRPHRQARTLEARIAATTDAGLRVSLLRELAGLMNGALSQPHAAADRLWTAAGLVEPHSEFHGAILRELGQVLADVGDADAWARCAEAELRTLDREKDVFDERRMELHRELARTYDCALGRPDAALAHLLAWVDAGGVADAGETSEDSALLRLLRVQGDWIELETRLSAQLERNPNDPAGWLELARLRDERLRWTAPAADAYRQLLEREPDHLAALRGLRGVAERLCDWNEVARTLETELEQTRSGAARAAILRRLGDLYWRRLESTTRASRSYASALEAEPEDLESLRSLQQLLEAMEDWRGAQDLYDSEIEMLGAAQPERRAEIANRSARHAMDRCADVDRAIRGFEYADRIAPLALDDVRRLAELYESKGDLGSYANAWQRWCDHPGANALDHLKLAETLDDLGDDSLALERTERAVAIDAELLPAWDLVARLRERAGDASGAADALAIAAELCDARGACERLTRAALLTWEDAPVTTASRLRGAVRKDPAAAEAHARLALIAERLGEFAEAELCAGRALDLAAAADLDVELWGECALAGGRAAVATGRIQSAVRCFAIAVEKTSDDPTALAGYGKVLAEAGDAERAREILERRLAMDGPNEERALQLCWIARGYRSAGDFERAQRNFEAALETDPRFDPAHEGLVDMWESAGRLDSGVACLERWADLAAAPSERAARLLRAAEWELRAGDPNGAAERHLREVLDTNPSELRPWEALTGLLWDRDRSDEALQVASLAMNGVDGAHASRSLALIQGRTLERIGERAEAAAAFAIAAAADPGCTEAALARARLLRMLGDWSGAAETLQTFADAHTGDDRSGLAEVLQQLGRLYAGPLEAADAAIAVYRRAIALNPDRIETHAALAEFLSNRPADWSEALAHHQWVLNADPSHLASLRVLMRITRDRSDRDTFALGLGIVRALGQASPADLTADLSGSTPRFSDERALPDPLWEKLRLVVSEAAPEISAALSAAETDPGPLPSDPIAAFHAAAVAAEGRLTAPALLPLTDRELGELVSIVCALALETEQIQGDGRRINALSAALKRRSRRRLRKILEGETVESIARVDFHAWRSAIRALAQTVAIDETRIDFGSALVSVARKSSDPALSDATPEQRARWISESREARALLRRAIGTWLGRL